MKLEKIIDFYKEISSYTDLGLYTKLAKNLPDDIKELCFLQRKNNSHSKLKN